MKQLSSSLSRRHFLKKSAGSVAALQAISMAGSAVYGLPAGKTVYLPPGSALPVETAAEELAERTGAAIVNRSHTGQIESGEIVLAVGSEVKAYPEAATLLPDPTAHREWELVKKVGDGLLFAGSTPRNVCHAALAWIENPRRETDRLSLFRFEERFTMWDNSLNQWYRFSKGFDRRRHVRDIARLGHTGMEINRYPDPGGYHVLHRKFPHDSYAWYMSYAPALDAFVESSLTEGIYPQDELAANLADLKSATRLARRYGLKPGFVCYEPRGVAEEVFDRYPELRGSRIDHPGRSLQPRYALDIANPKVLEHYAESISNLMAEVPDLRYFVFWTQDSGSGLPFARRLYFGPNGSYLARSKTLGRMAGDFAGSILDAGRKINPEFEVIMKIDWEYGDDERKEIAASMPEGATLAHILGDRAIKGGEFGGREQYVIDDRAVGVEPYASIGVSSSWETEPIIGITRPSVLVNKFAGLEKLRLQRIFTQGGIFPSTLCPYNVTQELYSELIRGKVEDLDRFLLDTATYWCKGDDEPARLLVQAWKVVEGALEEWPQLNWYHAGAAQTQARWLTRPVVPDITLLSESERIAWERALFTLPWDIARPNIVFEGGIRMYEEEDLARAVKAYDEGMFPKLTEAIEILNRALGPSAPPVIEDQRDRFLGFLYREKTVRNLFESQVAINNWLLKNGSPETNRQLLKSVIRAEIDNTGDWLRLLRTSRVPFFRVTERQETPFLYKTPIEDMELKLQVMQDHVNDTPGPFLKELTEEWSESNLLYYN